MKVLVVVPEFSSRLDGIGQYAELISGRLQHEGIESTLLSGNPDSIARERWEQVIKARTARAVHDSLTGIPYDLVILNYVGYGYSRWGCPRWLVEGCEMYAKQHPTPRFVTVVHEISGSGPPWSAGFWTSGSQRRITYRLADLSAAVITSREEFAEELRLRGGVQTPIEILPMLSTVGELENWSERSDSAVILFGSLAHRRRLFDHHLKELLLALEALDNFSFLEVGPGESALSSVLPKTHSLGALPIAELSNILRSTTIGVVDYPAEFLTKSTVFAGLCAHGVAPLVVGLGVGRPADKSGLIQGVHYLSAEQLLRTPKSEVGALLRKTGRAAFEWYMNHNLAAHAQRYREIIERVTIDGTANPSI